MRLKPVILLAMAVLLHSCCRFDGDAVFVKAADAIDGVYSFKADFSDSLATYDVSFYSVLSEPLMLDVSWISPSSELSLRDSVWLEPCDRKSVCALYRSGVCPEEKGVWTVEVRPADVPTGFCGLGIVTKNNGTR